MILLLAGTWSHFTHIQGPGTLFIVLGALVSCPGNHPTLGQCKVGVKRHLLLSTEKLAAGQAGLQARKQREVALFWLVILDGKARSVRRQ